MNLETTNRATGAAVGFVIATVLFVALAILVKLSVSAPAIDADRAAERSKALVEIRAAEDKSLNALTWADQARGIVHLPIATAMAQAAQAWQNPAAARADLIARQAKASAELPKAPEKPSAFE
jgi:tetrahydromethanopterin S-methyltransferase subunit F